jgi:hypothetical protein
VNRLRLCLAVIGFVLAVLSVVLTDSRIGWAAIAVLTMSAIVRLVQRKGDKTNSHDGPGV